MREASIVASVLGADYSILSSELEDLAHAGVDRVQWDIMDGHFVPNLTFGPDVVAACRPRTEVPFEAHLMVANPDQLLEGFVEAGCDTVIVHEETCTHLHRTLTNLRSMGASAGVALNPSTPLETVRHVLDQVDLLLVMTVNPGFGGQSYIRSMERKIAEARRLIDGEGLDTVVEVDGGIAPDTAPGARAAGAELFVAGSSILRHPEGKKAAVDELRAALGSAESQPVEASHR